MRKGILLVSLGLCAALASAQGNLKTATVAYKDDIATLDPAVGYDWQNWPAIKMLFDALLDYKPGTTDLEPRVAAAMPVVSDGGRSYTFTLRDGIKFSNGAALTAEDVKYTLERVLNPATKSPGAGFFTDIAGSADFAAGKAKTLVGVTVLAPNKVKITLSQPNAAFLNVLATNFAFIVPKAAAQAAGADFGRHPIGSGPFTLKSWDVGKQLTFDRNPTYFRPGVPGLDEVNIKVGMDPSVAYLGLQRGEVDLLGDGVPPAQYLQAQADPKLKALIVSLPQVNTTYLAINTGVKPFTDVRVRQALQYAIDKRKVIKLINGRGLVANQVLPPSMPGFDPNYKGPSYDPAKAKALLAAAGFKNGFSTTLYTTATDPNPRIAQSLQQDLAAVGIKVSIKAQAQSTVIDAAGTPKTAPLVWSGGMAWTQDYPDPSDFYWPILSCRSAIPGGWNWPFLCDKKLDTLAEKADRMTAANQRQARLDVYKQVFKGVMDQAAWVPMFNEVRYTMHSEKLTGKPTDFIDPIHYIGYERLSTK
ncbi:MAG TPA: ABC transporter substrate-binding protein [Deinococcales bacterium]|nr:ABC transporter substrate-binding protein [Deinococcales bacterium]